MKIKATCPQCGQVLEAPAEYAGKTVRCPKCKKGVLEIGEASPGLTDSGNPQQTAAILPDPLKASPPFDLLLAELQQLKHIAGTSAIRDQYLRQAVRQMAGSLNLGVAGLFMFISRAFSSNEFPYELFAYLFFVAGFTQILVSWIRVFLISVSDK